MNLLGIGISAFIVALSGALMPGPLLAVTVSEAVRRGARAGPLIVFGHGLLEIILIALVIAGLGKFITQPIFKATASLAGGVMLVVMGSMMLMVRNKIDFDNIEGKSQITGKPVLYGALASLSNPYWTIWWATIGLGYLVSAIKWGVLGVAVFFTGHILADLSWYWAVAYFVAKGRRIYASSVKWIVVGCGIALVAFGLLFFKSGVSLFLKI